MPVFQETQCICVTILISLTIVSHLTYLMVDVTCAVFSFVRTTVQLPTLEIFNVCTNVVACKHHSIRECALKVDYGRRVPYHTKESDRPTSAVCQMLQQLSFIPCRMCFHCC